MSFCKQVLTKKSSAKDTKDGITTKKATGDISIPKVEEPDAADSDSASGTKDNSPTTVAKIIGESSESTAGV